MDVWLNNKKYNIKNKWSEITIAEAVKLSEIETPEILKLIFELLDNYEKNKLLIEEKYLQLKKININTFYIRCINILSDIPDDVLIKANKEDIEVLFNTYIMLVYLSCQNFYPIVKHTTVLNFKVEDDWYYAPKHKTFFEKEIPMYNETIDTFIDCLTLLEMKMKGLPKLISALYKKKDEPYTDDLLDRDFSNLNMNIGWSAFSLVYLETYNYIKDSYNWVFDSGKEGRLDVKVNNALRRAKFSEIGNISLIFEVAQCGYFGGNIDKIKKINLHDFMSLLSYIRTNNKFDKFLMEEQNRK